MSKSPSKSRKSVPSPRLSSAREHALLRDLRRLYRVSPGAFVALEFVAASFRPDGKAGAR